MTQIVDSSGEIVAQYRYDSFGNILNSSETLSQPYTYTGREYDPETGLYYYRHRYYDAHTGRFLQEDPVWLAGGMNSYSYCANNPLHYVDPFGLRHSGKRNNCIPIAPIDDGMIYNENGLVIGEKGLEAPLIDPIDIAAFGAAGLAKSLGKSVAENTVKDTAEGIGRWLGNDATTITNESGDKIFLSRDGLRKVRFDIKDPTPHSSPHGHVEVFENGRWEKSGPIFPKNQ